MSDRTDLERLLHEHFVTTADPRPRPGRLDAILAQTSETRPRRPWRIPLRADRGAAAPVISRRTVSPWLVVLLVLVTLLLVAGFLLSGGHRDLAVVLPISSAPTSSATPTLAARPTPMPSPRQSAAVPTSASWSSTASIPDKQERAPAVLLPDGTVLVVGRFSDRYDPRSGTWSSAGRIPAQGSATLLRNGKVLVAGGASAELYDPSTNTWSATGSMIVARRGQAATLLADGRVLVAGGVGAGGTYDFLASAEIYDPSSGTWSATGSMSDTRGQVGTCCLGALQATLLHDDTVLVEGGTGQVRRRGGSPRTLATAELYDPSSGTWSTTGSMTTARNGHTATLLADGRVLVVGGLSASAEIYDPRSKRGAPLAQRPFLVGGIRPPSWPTVGYLWPEVPKVTRSPPPSSLTRGARRGAQRTRCQPFGHCTPRSSSSTAGSWWRVAGPTHTWWTPPSSTTRDRGTENTVSRCLPRIRSWGDE